MANCSECDAVLDFDAEEVDAGDVIVCDECGTEYEVVTTEPMELVKVDNEGYEEEDAKFADEEEE
jgi:alpha-aminoadipate carrier protein LysW